MTFDTNIYLMGKDCSKSSWQKENKTALLKNDCMFSSKRSWSFPADLFAYVCHCRDPRDHFISVRFNKLIIKFRSTNSRALGILSQLWLPLWWLEDQKYFQLRLMSWQCKFLQFLILSKLVSQIMAIPPFAKILTGWRIKALSFKLHLSFA